MGFSGGVFVINRDDFKLDIPHFEAALREQWPDVEFSQVIGDDVDFDLSPNDYSLRFAGVIIKQERIAWWGSYENFADFLLWFRQYVDSGYQLLVVDGDDYNSVLLQTDTTKAEIVKALESERYYFEIYSPLNTSQNLHTIAEKIDQIWLGDITVAQSGNKTRFHWYLHAQSGRIDIGEGKIYFDDIDLRFASKFAIWCRSLLPNDQKLMAQDGHSESAINLQTELASSTTETELFEFLTKSFAKE